MPLLGNIAQALRPPAPSGPRAEMPVPAGGTGPAGGGSWSVQGSKAAQLTVSSWNSTIYGIVDAQATAQSQVTWRLYRKARSGRPEDRTEVTTHPALDLWQHPNPFMTQADMIETLSNHYELTGEQWLAVSRAAGLNGAGPPLELWPMRPDRMLPAAHPTKFIVGYVFRSGRGDVPMGLGDVIYEKKPHPTDPYRGFSPIVAAMVDLRADREAAEYNAEFFANDATPSGIVKIPGYLPQPRWDELVQRWNEQHRGRGNSQRVHFMDQVENAEYVNLGYTRKDMQFTELRTWNTEAFMRAYRISDFVLGMLQDVNRATADAAAVWFGQAHTIPRANRTRSMLNMKLLGLYPGDLARGYEWDYDDVIPPDRVQATTERTAAISDAMTLIDAGYDEAEVFEWLDLPKLTRTAPEPAPAAPAPAGPDEGNETADDDTAEAPAARTNGHRRPAPAHA